MEISRSVLSLSLLSDLPTLHPIPKPHAPARRESVPMTVLTERSSDCVKHSSRFAHKTRCLIFIFVWRNFANFLHFGFKYPIFVGMHSCGHPHVLAIFAQGRAKNGQNAPNSQVFVVCIAFEQVSSLPVTFEDSPSATPGRPLIEKINLACFEVRLAVRKRDDADSGRSLWERHSPADRTRSLRPAWDVVTSL